MVAMIWAMLVMAVPGQDTVPAPSPSVDAIIAKTSEMTGIRRRCVYDPNATDITVCGRRNADRFRMPFEIPPEPGDPRHEGVMEERTRLLARSTPLKDLSPFQVGGGLAGVTMDTNPRGGHGPTLRKPAP
ncbi:hypothetical protein NZL82_05765 [Sphingomonas sanguinis]|uniref:hypothetical protein n=1 Tax=Sphingomonas sp. LC-1 TaxID=3110957 RepID=UPI0021BAAB75|nr:hypothetical protein [Sphingomonas sp. LC-1]MCT8001383.1 hypothetical protein [Sphingomonas sp. LC-1]